MPEILSNLMVLVAVLLIFTAIIRQMWPAKKQVYQGEALSCISQGKVFSSERLYFNRQGLFVYRSGQLQARYRWEDVQTLEKDTLVVNHVRVWQLMLQTAEGCRVFYRFRPTIGWGQNGFSGFYGYLKAVRPHAVKSQWRPWLPGI